MKEKILNNEKLNEIFERHKVGIAYLFGSQARGTATEMSDIDIAVVFGVPPPDSKYLHAEKLIADIEDFFGKRTDIVDLKRTTDPLLRHEAVFGGKCIFGEKNLHRFFLETSVMKEYEDTGHLRNVQYQNMREKIKKGSFGTAPIKSEYLKQHVAG